MRRSISFAVKSTRNVANSRCPPHLLVEHRSIVDQRHIVERGKRSVGSSIGRRPHGSTSGRHDESPPPLLRPISSQWCRRDRIAFESVVRRRLTSYHWS